MSQIEWRVGLARVHGIDFASFALAIRVIIVVTDFGWTKVFLCEAVLLQKGEIRVPTVDRQNHICSETTNLGSEHFEAQRACE
ncbi:hypothetical protein CH282_15600 [Rhodococcus sp. 06-418-1B]|nr:hypothetical protein CH282_15600 [Rhodococcus sp. 06-418-1B]